MVRKNGNEIDYIEGPYEQWSLGIGAPYAEGYAAKSDSSHYAAIVTFPAPVVAAPPDVIAPNETEMINTPRLPTIWGLSKNLKHQFLPVIAEVVSNKRSVSFQNLLQWARNYTGPVELAPNKPEVLKNFPDRAVVLGMNIPSARAAVQDIEEPGFRLNVPVPGDTIDDKFKQDTLEFVGKVMGQGSMSLSESKPKLVITAVIDDGIAYCHRNFQDIEGKSRIESCWLQSAKNDGSGRVLFGREMFRNEIDDALLKAGGDEELAYAAISMSEADRLYGTRMHRHATHGTHVLDIAAGHRHGCRQPRFTANDKEGLDRVRIIAVQLPPAAIADTVGFGKDAYILSAFHHIFERADAVFSAYEVTDPNDQWLTVNFSFGFTGGPHDGSGRIEQAISNLVAQRIALGKPTHVIMPAGNTFSSALYGEIQPSMLETDNEFEIPWRVQPNSRTASHLELWFPVDPAGAELTITAPGSAVSWSFSLNKPDTITFPPGQPAYGHAVLNKYSKGWWCVVISLAPTEPDDCTLPATPPGLWRIRFKQPEAYRLETPVYCRIQRSENPFGFAMGAKQSYFDDPEDAPYNDKGTLAAKDTPGAFVRRFGSLNGLAISKYIFIVGGVFADTQKPGDFSAAGPLIHPVDLPKPFVDLSAPSDDARGVPGRLASGTLSGSVARLSGTSVAAPFVVRQIALAALEGASFPLDPGVLGGAKSVSGPPWQYPHARARMGNYVLVDA